MSAEIVLLREVAKKMRADASACGDSPTDFIPLVADWLDTAGADIWAHGPMCICGTGCDACDDNLWEPHARDAIAVATAYLGSAS